MKNNITIYTTSGDGIRASVTKEQFNKIVNSIPEGMVLEIENTKYYIMPNQIVRIDIEKQKEVSINIDGKKFGAVLSEMNKHLKREAATISGASLDCPYPDCNPQGPSSDDKGTIAVDSKVLGVVSFREIRKHHQQMNAES